MFIFYTMTRLQDNSDNIQLEFIVIIRFYNLVFFILQFKVITLKIKMRQQFSKIKNILIKIFE